MLYAPGVRPASVYAPSAAGCDRLARTRVAASTALISAFGDRARRRRSSPCRGSLPSCLSRLRDMREARDEQQ